MRKLKVDSTLFIFWMVELEKRREIQKEKHQKETYTDLFFQISQKIIVFRMAALSLCEN